MSISYNIFDSYGPQYWKVEEISSEKYPNFNSTLPLKIVYHYENREWIPFVLVAESAILNYLNVEKGYGVYPLKNFKKNEYIGKYSGEILYGGHTINGLAYASYKFNILYPNYSKIYNAALYDGKIFKVVDGSINPSTPFLHLMNDSKNTGLPNNVFINSSKNGCATLLENIKKINLNIDLNQQIEKELCYNYGNAYWNSN